MCFLISKIGLQICIWSLSVLFFIFTSFGVFVAEDKVQFIVLSTFIWTKHDCIRGLVVELILQKQKLIILSKSSVRSKFQKCDIFPYKITNKSVTLKEKLIC